MSVYRFVLALSGALRPEEEIEDALFEAGCDDATLAWRSGISHFMKLPAGDAFPWGGE